MFYLIAHSEDYRPTKGHDLDAGLDLKARMIDPATLDDAYVIEDKDKLVYATGNVDIVRYSAGGVHRRAYIIAPGRVAKIPTGVHAVIKPGYVGRLLSRSGHASRGIVVVGGVIDPGFEGEINVLLHNTTQSPVEVPELSRIAQFIADRAETGRIMVADGGNLDGLIAGAANDVGTGTTTRGVGGFGSTGDTDESLLDSALLALVDSVVGALVPVADRINNAHGGTYVSRHDLLDMVAVLYAESLLNEKGVE